MENRSLKLHKNLTRAFSKVKRTAPHLWQLLQKKLRHPQDLTKWAFEQRQSNRSIATINGCFDLLHVGHLHILFESKAQADLLLLALNADESICERKGENRPIHKLYERLLQVSALCCVDFITYFWESNPIALIQSVQPDVHINGSEYGADCIESTAVKSHGGRLHLVDSLKGYSTTSIMQKIKGVL